VQAVPRIERREAQARRQLHRLRVDPAPQGHRVRPRALRRGRHEGSCLLGCPVSARKAVIAGTLAAALLGVGADQAAASYTGRIQDDTLTLTGNSASDKLL